MLSKTLPKQARNTLLLLLAISVFSLRFRTPLQAEEKIIIPDGVEYAVSAVNLLEGRGYTLFFEGEPHPPRAPFGYTLCLAPFYFLLGKSLGNGIFCTLLFSLLSFVLLFALAKGLFGNETAFWAVVFLTFSPLHLYWSRFIMADLPHTALLLLWVWLLFRKELTPQRGFWLGVILGVSLLFKFSSVLFILLFIPFLFGRGPLRKGLTTAGLFLLGVFLAVFPLLLYYRLTFGGFLKTGFLYWTLEWTRPSFLLSPQYAVSGPVLPAGASPNILAFFRFLLGIVSPWHQNPYPFFLVPFIGIGVHRILLDRTKGSAPRRKFLLFTLTTAAIFYGTFSLYFAQNMRYLLPVVPLLLIIAGFGWRQIFSELPSLVQKVIFCLVGILLAASPVVLHNIEKRLPLRKHYAKLILEKTESKAAVITGWDAVSFYHLIQKKSERKYLPLSRDVEYAQTPFPPDPRWPLSFLVAGKEPERVEEMVAAGIPVYMDNLSCLKHREECAILQRRLDFTEAGQKEGVVLYRLMKKGG